MNELIYGIHTVFSLLKKDPGRFLYMYILSGFLNKRLKLLLQYSKQFNIPVQYCNRSYLNNKVRCDVHQGIVAKIRETYIFREKDILIFLTKKKEHNRAFLLLVLDSVTDPRNLGACLRSAAAFGVDLVLVPRRRSVGLNSVVRKVASGAADSVPFIRVTNLARTLQLLREHNVWIVGTVLQSKFSNNIFKTKLSDRRLLAIVMGSEKSGIRFLTKKYCDELVKIPMIDSLQSLNVAVATGICLYETLRQRVYHKH